MAQNTLVKNVVLVHGAFADGSSWSKVIPLLQAKGFHVRSVGIPLTSFADDVAATKRAIGACHKPFCHALAAQRGGEGYRRRGIRQEVRKRHFSVHAARFHS